MQSAWVQWNRINHDFAFWSFKISLKPWNFMCHVPNMTNWILFDSSNIPYRSFTLIVRMLENHLLKEWLYYENWTVVVYRDSSLINILLSFNELFKIMKHCSQARLLISFLDWNWLIQIDFAIYLSSKVLSQCNCVLKTVQLIPFILSYIQIVLWMIY